MIRALVLGALGGLVVVAVMFAVATWSLPRLLRHWDKVLRDERRKP